MEGRRDMALDAVETRALRALRAPGGMTAGQAWERWPTYGTKPLHALVRAGLAANDGERFTITEAGRAACPFANPILAARAAGKPKEAIMPVQRKLNQSALIAAIEAAGPDGATVKKLTEVLGVSDQTVFNVFKKLTPAGGAAVTRMKGGIYVATRLVAAPAETHTEAAPDAASQEIPEAEVAKIAREYDEMIDFDLEAAQSVDVTAAGPGRPVHLVVADVHIAHPDGVEFCLYSSGRMELLTEDGPTVELSAAVLRKLRDFLGLFAECE